MTSAAFQPGAFWASKRLVYMQSLWGAASRSPAALESSAFRVFWRRTVRASERLISVNWTFWMQEHQPIRKTDPWVFLQEIDTKTFFYELWRKKRLYIPKLTKNFKTCRQKKKKKNCMFWYLAFTTNLTNYLYSLPVATNGSGNDQQAASQRCAGGLVHRKRTAYFRSNWMHRWSLEVDFIVWKCVKTIFLINKAKLFSSF